jgi:hypothetical protein
VTAGHLETNLDGSSLTYTPAGGGPKSTWIWDDITTVYHNPETGQDWEFDLVTRRFTVTSGSSSEGMTGTYEECLLTAGI